MKNDLINYIFKDIPSYAEWGIIEKINKGWSKDKKYYIKNISGEELLLRLSDFKFYEIKKKEFDSMKEVYKLGINMSKPISFGVCGDGKYVYSLLSWIKGKSVNQVVKELSYEEQYRLGVEAGKILKKMHSIKAPIGQEDWGERMVKKINNHLIKYKECGIKLSNDEFAIKHITKNLHLLKGRSQKYQHGDFHIGNLIITPDKELGVIDFNRWDYGDTIEEFYKMVLFSRELSVQFSKGQINGYFDNNIPNDFFDILSLYVADVILFSIVWAIPFGKEDVDGMIKRAEMILDDYDNFNLVIPKWFEDALKGR
ncbi:MAG: aminoglycoside phosphotransferase family protein [Clostridium sp.]